MTTKTQAKRNRTSSPPPPSTGTYDPLSDLDHYPNSELVLGVVSPVGIDNRRLKAALEKALDFYSYKINPIRLTDFLKTLPDGYLTRKIDTSSEYARINTSMDAGNEVRRKIQSGSALARYAALVVHQSRQKEAGQRAPSRSTAHVLFTLKHPREVEVLRRIYGPGFFLIAVHAEESLRIAHLMAQDMSEEQAKLLVARDQDEETKLGQRTRDTFELADVFVRQAHRLEENVERFVNLVFGSPKEFPTPDEQAMFMAHAAALRSADLSRQVGAVIINQYGDLIATGCNDVPRAGGGQYPGPRLEDQRDYKRGFDSNAKMIGEIAADTTARLGVRMPEVGTEEYDCLRGGRLYDLTEFGRAVHAEMEAITCCARNGVSARFGTLFTTTFPCHNCAKHIVGAGIRRVVYVEPYPKSMALDLHDDVIELESPEDHAEQVFGPPSPFAVFEKVCFRPFVGVGARRYVDLFSKKLSTGKPIERKDKAGQAVGWTRHSGSPRVPLWPASYLEREKVAVQKLVSKLPPPPREDEERVDRKRRSRQP